MNMIKSLNEDYFDNLDIKEDDLDLDSDVMYNDNNHVYQYDFVFFLSVINYCSLYAEPYMLYVKKVLEYILINNDMITDYEIQFIDDNAKYINIDNLTRYDVGNGIVWWCDTKSTISNIGNEEIQYNNTAWRVANYAPGARLLFDTYEDINIKDIMKLFYHLSMPLGKRDWGICISSMTLPWGKNTVYLDVSSNSTLIELLKKRKKEKL